MPGLDQVSGGHSLVFCKDLSQNQRRVAGGERQTSDNIDSLQSRRLFGRCTLVRNGPPF